MNSDSSIAAHLPVGPKINGQQNFIDAVFPVYGGLRLTC